MKANASDYLNPTDDPFIEIVKCIAKIDDTLIVMRSQQQTLALSSNVMNGMQIEEYCFIKNFLKEIDMIHKLRDSKS